MIVSLASTFLAATSVTSLSPSSKQEIVVVGHAIDAAKTNLAACLARHCPPNEDIDASLGLAEAQLLAGKYRDARFTLLASLGRNKREADAYPIPVSDLYRANGRVAANLGYDDDFYRSTWGIYRTLKHGLPDAKDRQYSALMEVAEMMGKTRGHERARIYYERIAHRAREDGRPDIAALAELRLTLRHMPPYLRENGVKRILSGLDPSLRAPILEGKLALARMAYEKHQTAKGDEIVGELASMDIKKPILVYAPAWELGAGSYDLGSESQLGSVSSGQATSPAGGDGRGGGATSGGYFGEGANLAHAAAAAAPSAFSTARMPLNVEDMWVDVGFHITAEGKVTNVEVLRKHGDIGWAKPLLASIGGRVYTPAKANAPESYRKERYTYTSGLETGAGTKMAEHSPQPRVEYLDLSDISASN